MTKGRWPLIIKMLGIALAAGVILYATLLWWPQHQAAQLPKQVGPLDRFNAEGWTRQTAATIIAISDNFVVHQGAP